VLNGLMTNLEHVADSRTQGVVYETIVQVASVLDEG
jgi:hypothetical protein